MNENKNIAVLGVGRFGLSIIEALSDYDVNILACDKLESRLQLISEYATHMVVADFSDETALHNLGLGNFDVVVLSMTEDFEATMIATMVAKESGARHIIAKAKNKRQQKILKNIGADEVVIPEHQMGDRLARRLVDPNILDIIDASDTYTITEMRPHPEWIGKTIRQSDIRKNQNITILAVKHDGNVSTPVSPDRTIDSGDTLIVLSEILPE